MKYAENVTDLIGGTPLVQLNRVTSGVKPLVLAKLEYMNPGGSVKDRIAGNMIDYAEQEGLLKPGGTIIEGTSGNTGMGLAMIAAERGYKMIFTIPDKMSSEKIDALKAFGGKVIVTPTAVEPDDPTSYYSVAKKLHDQIDNSFYPNQYFNDRNPEAHYKTTGPEIWEDTEGKVSAFIATMGTGGTITGTGKYLREKNSEVKLIGIDAVGSIFTYVHAYLKSTGEIPDPLPPAHSYKVEGFGEDLLPSSLDLGIVDKVIPVSDGECFGMARRLAKEEGLFVGGSSGAAVVGALKVAEDMDEDDVMVVLLPDGGQKYVSKIFNDDWMRENGFKEYL